MFESFLKTYGFGSRIYAHKKWWTQIEFITTVVDGAVFLVADGTRAPTKAHIIVQTDADKKYQLVLFRKFNDDLPNSKEQSQE